MARTYIAETTVDDLMRSVFQEIEERGDHVLASKGRNREIMGVLLELTNPRARLSRTESRGKLFSCLGLLCWYLAKANDLPFISYYLQNYGDYADGDLIFGGYGPRLFNWGGLNQVANVINLLKTKRSTRQAVIQLFDAHDIVAEHKEIPCTCTLQFMVRHRALHMFTCMRSNDVIWGLPHDLFCFTMLQDIVARDLGIEIGTYKQAVGSLHLYDNKIDEAKSFLSEGLQSTLEPMPPMPGGDPWPNIGLLLEAEASLRTGRSFDVTKLIKIDPYWVDLVRLLQVFRAKQDGDRSAIMELRRNMASKIYLPFIKSGRTELQ
jgi:thymidylate synthase